MNFYIGSGSFQGKKLEAKLKEPKRGCENREEGLLLVTAEEAFPAETNFKRSSIFCVIFLIRYNLFMYFVYCLCVSVFPLEYK